MAYLSKVFRYNRIRRRDSHDIHPAVHIVTKADIATNSGGRVFHQNLAYRAIAPHPHLAALCYASLCHYADNVKSARREYHFSVSVWGSGNALPFNGGMARPVNVLDEESALVGGGIGT
jgi:hypothetical protein